MAPRLRRPPRTLPARVTPPTPVQPAYMATSLDVRTNTPNFNLYEVAPGDTVDKATLPPAPPAPVEEPLTRTAINFFRNLVDDRNAWNSPTTWNGCYSVSHRCLIMAMAAKLATVSSGAGRDDFKTAIGANSITPVSALSPLAPDGIIIEFDSHVIFVIAGASRREQLVAIRAGMGTYSDATNHFQFANPTGISKTPSFSDAIEATNRTSEIGLAFPPFVDVANPWIQRIQLWIKDHWDGHQIFLVGHSLGAVICELAACYFGLWRDSMLPHLAARAVAGVGAPYTSFNTAIGSKQYPEIRGGMVFGQPFGFFEERTVLENARNPTTRSYLERQAARLFRYDHPADPVTRVPIPRGGFFWNPLWGNSMGVSRSEGTKWTTQIPLRQALLRPAWANANRALLEPPSNLAILKERCQVYHSIDAYLRNVYDGLVEDRWGPPTGDWPTLVASVLALTGTSSFDWE